MRGPDQEGRAEVDAAAGLVRAAGQAWPFDVDCRSGMAEVEIGGRVYRLRPLRWHEKRTLARFATAGEAFLERQFLRLCLVEDGEGAATALDGAARQVLNALARWVNAPEPGETHLPLAAPLLAQVTLQLCRATGLAPAAFDGREAYEVEMLWQAAGPESEEGRRTGAARPAPRAWEEEEEDDLEPGTTRIVIVPDLPPLTSPPGPLSHLPPFPWERGNAGEAVRRDLDSVPADSFGAPSPTLPRADARERAPSARPSFEADSEVHSEVSADSLISNAGTEGPQPTSREDLSAPNVETPRGASPDRGEPSGPPGRLGGRNQGFQSSTLRAARGPAAIDYGPSRPGDAPRGVSTLGTETSSRLERFRLSDPEVPADSPTPSRPGGGALSRAAGEGRGGGLKTRHDRAPRFRVSLPSEAPSTPSPSLLSLPSLSSLPSSAPEPAADLWASLLPPPEAPEPAAAGHPALDPDSQDTLFEELARRLDQAACELGIDVEE